MRSAKVVGLNFLGRVGTEHDDVEACKWLQLAADAELLDASEGASRGAK